MADNQFDIIHMTELILKPIARDVRTSYLDKGTDKMELFQPFTVSFYYKGVLYEITVPRGFIIDGSSIPKIFHTVYHPFVTEAIWASVIHDHIYANAYHIYSKEFADELFKAMIEHCGGGWWMSTCFYNAVRLNIKGGGWHNDY